MRLFISHKNLGSQEVSTKISLINAEWRSRQRLEKIVLSVPDRVYIVQCACYSLCNLLVTELGPESRNPNSNQNTILKIYFLKDIVYGNYINQITKGKLSFERWIIWQDIVWSTIVSKILTHLSASDCTLWLPRVIMHTYYIMIILNFFLRKKYYYLCPELCLLAVLLLFAKANIC